MQYIIPIILLIASFGILSNFISPLSQEVQEVKQQSALLDDALRNTQRIQTMRDNLLEEYNTVNSAHITKLEKILPDNVDNVRLILEVDKVASRYGMVIQDIDIIEEREQDDFLGSEEVSYGTIDLAFSIVGSYDSFRQFITELERSLRIVDIRGLSFTSTGANRNEFNLDVRTYWLK